MGHVDVLKRDLFDFDSGRAQRKKANPRNGWRIESWWDRSLSMKNQALAVHVRGGSKYDGMLMIWARSS